jgi:hypothetical protein
VARYHVVERFTGRPEIADFMERVTSQWLAESRAAGASPCVFRSVGTRVIALLGRTHASGNAYVSLLRFDGPAEWGRCGDPVRPPGGTWFSPSRKVSVEGRVIGSSLRHRPPPQV